MKLRKTKKTSKKSIRKTSKKSIKKASRKIRGGTKYNDLSKLKYFTHITSIKNLNNILKEEKLLTQNEIINKKIKLYETQGAVDAKGEIILSEEFNGVYMSPIFDFDLQKINNEIMNNSIILIFDKSLINRKDYHINEDDSFGKISSSKTWSNNKYINVGINRIYESIKNNLLPEIIFHHNVSLRYLQSIIINNKNKYNEVFSLLKKYNIDIPIILSDDKYPDIKYESKNITEEDKLLNPNFCSWFFTIENIDEDKKNQVMTKIYENCNIIDDDTKQKFLSREISYDNQMFKIPSVNYPPYIYHKGSYKKIQKMTENKNIKNQIKEEKHKKDKLKKIKKIIDNINKDNLPKIEDFEEYDEYKLNKLLKINTKESLELFDKVYDTNFKILEPILGSKEKVIDTYIKPYTVEIK